MKLESFGIIIELKPFGDRDFLTKIFTKEFGLMVGFFKAGQVAKKKPLVGRFGAVSWSARIETQLGLFSFECEKNLIAPFLSNPKRLSEINSCFALLSAFLSEREPYKNLYESTLCFLCGDKSYLEWEQILLGDLGYGLCLDKCCNCGDKNPMYISLKTGRAVCEKCGEPYKDRLYKFPLNFEIMEKFLCQIGDIPTCRKYILQ